MFFAKKQASSLIIQGPEINVASVFEKSSFKHIRATTARLETVEDDERQMMPPMMPTLTAASRATVG